MKKVKHSIKKYWDWRSATYGYDTDKSVTIADRWEAVVKELVSGPSGRSALDIGTGTGQFAYYLARSGLEVTGIDISEKMISQAREYARTHQFDIDFRTGDAEELEFADNTFDVLVSRNLLWTLPRPDRALKEWRRVMKPGGTLVVSDGFWMNTTWRRVHHLAFKALKGIFQKRSIISLRFFGSYAGIHRFLPFYEGIRFEEANAILQNACFKEIQAHDVSCFGVHPYGGENGTKKSSPPFFIASAKT